MSLMPRTEGRTVGLQGQPIVRPAGGEGLAAAGAAFAGAARALGAEAAGMAREEEAAEIANAREAGLSDVTLGPDGRPRITTVDNSTPANRARRDAALGAYQAREEDWWRQQAIALRGQAGTDPAKFRSLWDGAVAGGLANVPEEFRPQIGQLAARVGALHQVDITRDVLRQDDANNRAALSTGLATARDRVWALADLGQREGAEWAQARQAHETAIGRLRAAGLMNEEQERHERALTAAEGEARLIAARTVAEARGPRGVAQAPAPLRPIFDAATQAAGLSPDQASVFAGLVGVESNWNPTARNPASTARGLTQVLRGTAENPGFGIAPIAYDDLDKPEVALEFGARYFKAMLDRNGGNVRLALRDYYAGAGQTDPRILAEGDRYATRVLARAGRPNDVADQLETDLAGMDVPEPRRLRIVTQARADLARVETERRQALQDVALQAQDLTARLSAGFDIAPDALLSLSRQASEMGDAALSARLLRQAEVQGTLVAARRLPLAELQAMAAAATTRASQEGADGTSAQLAQGLARTAEAKARALGADALAYGARVHQAAVGPLAPVNWADPEAARQGLAARLAQAQRIAALESGVPVLPLTRPELAGLKTAFAAAAPDAQAGLLRSLAGGLGTDAYLAVLSEVGSARDGALMAVAGAVAQRDVLLARAMLDGQAIVRDAKLDVGSEPARQAALASDVRQVLSGLPAQTVEQVMAGAAGLYASRTFREHGPGRAFDASRFNQAVTDILGEPVRWNGRAVPPPRFGMDQAGFNAVMARLTDADLAGATSLRGQPVTADMVRRHATLRPVGEGVVVLDFVQGTALDPTGRDFRLDLRPLVDRAPSAVTPPPAATVPGAAQRPGQRVMPNGARRIDGWDDEGPR